MSDATWITEQVNAAKKIHLVPDSVLTRMVELLKGQLTERQLTATEISSVAGSLIADMEPPNKLSEDIKP